MDSNSLLLCCGVLLLCCFQAVVSLECYTCDNQDTNKDKCIKTTKQCEEYHDICITTIKWGLPPYWVPYGDRQHYVWKDCDTRNSCEAKKAAMMSHCKRDWWDDWQCVECCSGDMCNYYVTLGAGSKTPSVLIISVGLLAALYRVIFA